MAADIADRRARDRSGLDGSLLALLVGFLLLIASVLGAIWLTARQQEAVGWVSHTLEVENQVSLVMSRLQDAETGQRGFLLTGRDEFLRPYEEAVRNVPQDLDQLRRPDDGQSAAGSGDRASGPRRRFPRTAA